MSGVLISRLVIILFCGSLFLSNLWLSRFGSNVALKFLCVFLGTDLPPVSHALILTPTEFKSNGTTYVNRKYT